MIKQQLKQELEAILSKKEIEVVIKRLNNKHITQTESNYLSRSIRPKLKSAEFAASIELFSLLDYRRKKHEREDKILREKMLHAVKDILNNIKAIILFGSYVRNSHANYKDIDAMIVLKKRLWKNSAEKHRLKKSIEKTIDLKTDISLMVYSELVKLLPYSPLLQTELENHKILYGNVRVAKKIIINKAYLYRKLLEAEQVLEMGKSIDSRYIYNAIRNCLSIELYLKMKVDNKLIIKTIEENIGKATAESLLDNKADTVQRDIAVIYLKYLFRKLKGVLK